MSTTQRAFFFSDLLNPAIESNSMHHQPLEELGNCRSFLELDEQRIKLIQLKLVNFNNMLQNQYQGEEIICTFTEKGAYWLKHSALQSSINTLQQTVDETQQKNKLAVWRLTSSEMIAYHINNLRYLFQILSHDSIILNELKPFMNDQHQRMLRELGELRTKVLRMLQVLKENGAQRIRITGKFFDQLERCRITRMMLKCGMLDEITLGYTEKELHQAEGFLEERCQSIQPSFHQHLQAIFEEILVDLLEGERIQFIHSHHWADFFYEREDLPAGYTGLAQLFFLQREGHASFMSTRLEELALCDYCHNIAEKMWDRYTEACAVTEGEPSSEQTAVDVEDQDLDDLINSIVQGKEFKQTLPSPSTLVKQRKLSRLGMVFPDRKR